MSARTALGLWLLALLLARSALGAGAGAPAEAPVEIRRVAVLVGANHAAAGRLALRYAHRDADKMARALSQVGGFAPADVIVLREPEPTEILAALDRELGRLRARPGESLLFFYFSGHADHEAVYSRGQPLLLRALRDRLDDPAATVRIGFIDACRGGGWTRAKGLTQTEPFEISLPAPGLSNEGAAFLASSSGLENAHESEHIKGSFFTHHFVAGLLGAADQTGDGAVSLTEAFDYAKQLTIRDTATFAGLAQHPSFELKLRGRQDLTLSQVLSSRSVIQVRQTQGPLEIIHLGSGLLLAELPPGRRELRIALPAGRYLVRRPQPGGLYALELEVERGEAVLREDELRPVRRELLLAKGAVAPKPPPFSTGSTVGRGMLELRTAIGVRYRDLGYGGIGLRTGVLSDEGADPTERGAERALALWLAASLGLTERLQWTVGTGALAYRFGRRGGVEVVPWGGLTSWALGYRQDRGLTFSYGLGLGLDLRLWPTTEQGLLVSLAAASEGAAGGVRVLPTTWRTRIGLGYGLTVRRVVTLNLALALEQNLLYTGRLADPSPTGAELDLTLRLGAVQSLALRPLPLIQVHLNRYVSLDGYAGLGIRLRDNSLQEHYLLGLTFTAF